MAITQKLPTAEELWRLPDDGQRHELVAGELRSMSPGGAQHGRIGVQIVSPLHQYVRANDLGEVLGAETGFLLTTSPDTVRAPDAAIVRKERAAAVGDMAGYWPGAPDLAVEVFSPNDLYTQVDERVAAWLAAGTRMVIVINPRRRTAAVHRATTQVRQLSKGTRSTPKTSCRTGRCPFATSLRERRSPDSRGRGPASVPPACGP